MRGKRGFDFFQPGNVAADGLQIDAPFFEAAFHHERDQSLRQIHQIVELTVGDFRLDHPEFGEVTARLRFFGAKGWAERVHLAEGHGRGLDIELTGLGEVRLLVEIIDGEQRACAFASRRSENRRIGEGEAALVEEIADGFDDLRAHAEDRCLALRAHPEMAMLHEELGAMLFGRDGVRIGLGHALDNLNVDHVEFVAAGRALIGADFALDDHARLLGEGLDGFEHFGRDRVFRHHALNDARAVAKLREQKLAALAQVIEPAAQRDGLAVVLSDFCDSTHG